MGQEEFRLALLDAAERNHYGIFDETTLLDKIRSDIDAGARFVALYQGNVHKTRFLVITSRATHFVRVGLHIENACRTILYSELEDVFARRTHTREIVIDGVVLKTADHLMEFTLGMDRSNAEDPDRQQHALIVAEGAARTISTARSRYLDVPQDHPAMA